MITKEGDKKLFLLDAFALIFRAYFAFSKNPRINSKGINTSAVFGFTNAMIDILRNEKPTHLAVVFDPSGPVHRMDDFAEYKANRDETPEDIKISVPLIHGLLEGFNIPKVVVDGYEADDVIGTLAKQAEKEGYTVYMMTPDKDYAQLVSENIFMYRPARMGNAAEVWGIPQVQEKFEVERVEQVIDILGMWGDAVDNIPGIPGVGEKTAKKFIKLYGGMEGLYENVDQLKGKQKEKVEANKELAFLSKKLATIITDVEVDFNFDDAKVGEYDKEKLRKMFTELEFRRMSERILGETIVPEGEQIDMFSTSTPVAEKVEEKTEVKTLENTEHTYKSADTKELRQELIQELLKQKEYCFDTETTSVDPLLAEIVGLAFSFKNNEAWYVPIPADQEEAKSIVAEFEQVLTADNIVKIAHNAKYDLHVLANYGVSVKAPMYDTMIAHFLLEPDNNRRSMDALAEQYLNYQPQSITTLIGKKGKDQKSMRDVPVADVVEYAGEDADITLQLKDKINKDIEAKEADKLLLDLELPLMPVLASMEREGIRLDKDMLADYSEKLGVEIESIEDKIYQHAGLPFNIGSPKQVGEILFERLKVTNKPKKTKTGQYATNEEVLQKLSGSHPIVDEILNYRELVKLKNTYVDPLPGMINPNTGRIHTSYNQVVAATGRLSSDKPNLQNIPIRTERGREIRKAFIPRDEDHLILSADYSQVELRIIAALSKDEGMLNAFNNGIDIHTSTASKVYGIPLDEVTRELRSNAKTVNFGIIYGISAFGLSQRIGISRKEAKSIIDNYFEQFPRIKGFMDESIQYAREHGYVQTVLGRKRYLRDINSANAVVRGFAERNAINSPIQGTAADLIKIAMINVHNRLQKENLKSKMLLQVHDELIFDVHKSEVDQLKALVIEEMSGAMDIGVRFEVEAEVGNNWLEAH